MSALDSNFSRDDLETLIEAMGDWEMMGNQDYHIMQIVKNMPMPPEDHEAYDSIQSIKEHFHNREREIKASRVTRQEKAVFLKAKLMLVRRDLGIDQLFEMSNAMDVSSGLTSDVPKEKVPEEKVAQSKPEANSDTPENASKLQLAEDFILDLGVWEHYQKFLDDRKA